LIWTRPKLIRDQILSSAARQFLEGDVQHWWHMPTGRGVRTHFSDDLLWLPFVVNYYLNISEDYSILEEKISFLNGPLLKLEQEDSYFTPETTEESATLYEHCARALDHSLKLGEHNLPLMGGGDWNDGMNKVGHEGKGESVWLAWFLIFNLKNFSKIAESRGEKPRGEIWKSHIVKIKKGIDENAWDGQWYRRAFYDDGTPMGSAENSECRIDSLAQTWSIISGAGDFNKSLQAMESVEKNLVKQNEGIILLLTPPFNKSSQNPGYIKGYIPGVRENGGQYTHAAIWCIQAYIGIGKSKRAVELFSMINPINHSLSKLEAMRYKVEPFVIAADVYSEWPHIGRGGWTWYTGSAGWMYTTGIESVLGFQLIGNKLKINPHVNSDWKSYKIKYRHFTTNYEIEIKNPNGLSTGKGKISLDGKLLANDQTFIELIDDGQNHLMEVELI
ncbi:MAG: protein ndvB, partial [Bacteriovorax sp.]|nr:protein ndvB [Bacteriovorax sp.]